MREFLVVEKLRGRMGDCSSSRLIFTIHSIFVRGVFLSLGTIDVVVCLIHLDIRCLFGGSVHGHQCRLVNLHQCFVHIPVVLALIFARLHRT